MNGIQINEDVARQLTREEKEHAARQCPFHAIELDGETLRIGADCRLCGLCVKGGAPGLFVMEEHADSGTVQKSDWKGVAVYIEFAGGEIHPVSLELLGKAKELAQKVDFPVYALLIGSETEHAAETLRHYGVDTVYDYDDEALRYFIAKPYAVVFSRFIGQVKPSSVLIGATAWGRSLAPRVAARVHAGLTADCTKLDMADNTDLIQIRPAFGGNIMAEIRTTNSRPQMATVRYKIFDAPERSEMPAGEIIRCPTKGLDLTDGVRVVSVQPKRQVPSISEAEIIVAAGRGIQSQKDMALAQKLADVLHAELACTRPLVEQGWVEADRQIGLSGRSVKPKLIFTLGVSGSVQFKAGMENSECIISVNQDVDAPIFHHAHYAVRGDLYEIVPALIDLIEKSRSDEKGGDPYV